MEPWTQRTVVVYGAERGWRLACDAELRARGVRPRLASGLAEMVKCLRGADGLLLVVDGSLPPGVSVSGAVVVQREGSESGSATVTRIASQVVEQKDVR